MLWYNQYYGMISAMVAMVILFPLQHIEVEESSEASAVPILQVSSHEEEPLQVEQVTSPKPTPQVVVSPLNKPPSSPRQDQPLIASPQTSRGPSPTLSTESESSSVAEGSSTAVRRPSPPPCSLRERVSIGYTPKARWLNDQPSAEGTR